MSSLDDSLYITVEGIDGSGKTLISEELSDMFGAVLVREPSELWTGEVTREAFEGHDINKIAKFYMFMADRVALNKKIIEPNLREHGLVISDRGPDSTRAYQYVDADLSDSLIESNLSKVLNPDLTILLDLDVEDAMRRYESGDTFEKRATQRKVRLRYLDLAERYSRIKIVDAKQEIDCVVGEAAEIIGNYES